MDERQREPFYEDEIDLYELWLKLKKRWKIVVGTFLLFMIASLIYVFTAKPIYTSSFIIKIGKDPTILLGNATSKGVQLIFLPEEFARLINAKASNLKVDGLKSVDASPIIKRGSGELFSPVKITIEAYKSETIPEAYRELLEILNSDETITSKVEFLRSSLEERLGKLKETLRDARRYRSILEKRGSDYAKLVEMDKIIADLEKEVLYTEYLIRELKPFEVLYEPPVPRNPSKPKKALILAVAGVSSIFLGIFLALFAEWLEEARKRHEQEVSKT